MQYVLRSTKKASDNAVLLSNINNTVEIAFGIYQSYIFEI